MGGTLVPNLRSARCCYRRAAANPVPLAVSHIGNAANIGLVMAAFSLGGLTAPQWGILPDANASMSSLPWMP